MRVRVSGENKEKKNIKLIFNTKEFSWGNCTQGIALISVAMLNGGKIFRKCFDESCLV